MFWLRYSSITKKQSQLHIAIRHGSVAHMEEEMRDVDVWFCGPTE